MSDAIKITHINWWLMLEREKYPYLITTERGCLPEVGKWSDGYECFIPVYLVGVSDYVLQNDSDFYVCPSKKAMQTKVQALWDGLSSEQQQSEFERWQAEFPWLKIKPGLEEKRRKRLLKNAKVDLEFASGRLKRLQEEIDKIQAEIERLSRPVQGAET